MRQHRAAPLLPLHSLQRRLLETTRSARVCNQGVSARGRTGRRFLPRPRGIPPGSARTRRRRSWPRAARSNTRANCKPSSTGQSNESAWQKQWPPSKPTSPRLFSAPREMIYYPVACLRSTPKLLPANCFAYFIVMSRTYFWELLSRLSRFWRLHFPCYGGRSILRDLFRLVRILVRAKAMDTIRNRLRFWFRIPNSSNGCAPASTSWSRFPAFLFFDAAGLLHRRGRDLGLRFRGVLGLLTRCDFRFRAFAFVLPDQQCRGDCRISFSGCPVAALE